MRALKETLSIGGQAVLEGVMMRSPHAFTVAVRKGGRPGAEIALFTEPLKPLGDRFPFLKRKIVRGTAALFEALWLGIRALDFSANEAIETDDGKKQEIGSLAMAATMVVSLVLALGLFLALPLLLTNLLGMQYGAVSRNSLVFNIMDGTFRVAIFLGYISSISFMKDIRRVFEYHGAEHKAIAAYEAGEELTLENVGKYPRIHPRCGTSFLLVVIALSIVIFSLIPGNWPFWAKAVSRVVLLPIVAGFSYEFIKMSAKKRGSRVIEVLIRPGLWLQRLTTREPSNEQLEVAIRAVTVALSMEPMEPR